MKKADPNYDDIYDFVLPNDEDSVGRGSGKSRNTGSRIGGILTGIVLVAALIVFCIAGYKLFTIYSDYHGATKEYEALKEEYVQVDENEQVVGVDFDSLKAINSDIVGWIRFEEPSIINYPVMKHSDNDYYLTHTYDGSSYGSGALFINMDNAGDFTDSNTFIYGHNMKNGAMFGELKKYLDEDFYKEHPYFYLYTADGKAYKYQVLSMYETTDSSDSYEMYSAPSQEFESYVNKVRMRSNYFVTPDIELDRDVKLLSLSTCTNQAAEGRYLLHAVRLGEVEVVQENTEEQTENAE